MPWNLLSIGIASQDPYAFSHYPDPPKVLSQWRSYGDDGKGAAIGFNEAFLKCKSNKPSKFLLACVYENHESFIDDLIRSHYKEIEEITKLYKKLLAVNTFWRALEDMGDVLQTLYSQILRIKNEAFIEEQEERLILNRPIEEIKTRVSNNLIIPYIEHQVCNEQEKEYFWCKAPEIWFGPKSDPRNLQSIKAFGQLGWSSGKGIFTYDCGYI